MRRFAQQARDYCLWSFALSIILVAVLVCVFRVALLQLHEFRQTAESLLSESLGASVHIGSVSGRAASAQFHITDVDVGEGGWQISELLASPNYLKSAMRRTLVWHKLELTDVVLELVQNQQGGWRFKGMQPSGGSSIGLAPIERMLLASETIVLNNAGHRVPVFRWQYGPRAAAGVDVGKGLRFSSHHIGWLAWTSRKRFGVDN